MRHFSPGRFEPPYKYARLTRRLKSFLQSPCAQIRTRRRRNLPVQHRLGPKEAVEAARVWRHGSGLLNDPYAVVLSRVFPCPAETINVPLDWNIGMMESPDSRRTSPCCCPDLARRCWSPITPRPGRPLRCHWVLNTQFLELINDDVTAMESLFVLPALRRT
jgi:hypothetical protein